jgi:dUTP pyrophosphatase
MSKVTFKIKKINPEAKLPTYAHPGDVGMDVCSLEEKNLMPGEHHIFFLGFAAEFPEGFATIVKDKGSIAKIGLHVTGGVFDAGYRGEYNIHLVNLGDQPYIVEKGDKIAQLVVFPVEIVSLEEVSELSSSSRGEGRWGSTGRK